MGSPVQDPAGQPPADPDADASTGLRGLFRRGADRGMAGQPSASEHGSADRGITRQPPASEHGSADRGITRQPPASEHGSADRRITRQPPASDRVGADRGITRQPPVRPIVSKPIINPRLRADPRLRVWVTRAILAVLVYLGFMIWHGWRIGLTAAAVFVAADVVFRSKTMSTVPPAARVTAAQRSTRRRLKMLQPAGYLALNARTIPSTRSVIDHVVIGPAGVFTIDSQRLDRRLILLARGGMLYHGPRSMEPRLDHAQNEADQASALISAELGYKVKARPVMVIYGPSIPWVVMTLKGIDVFEGSRVGTYFRKQTKASKGKQLDARRIEEIYAAADRALPPLG